MKSRPIPKLNLIVAALLAVCFASLAAQTATPPTSAAAATPKPQPGSITAHAGWPEPRPDDVRTVDGILAALYDVISGPAGQQRDWNRMRSLFVPDAKLIPIRVLAGSPDSTHPATDIVYMSVEDYIARASGNMTAQGFFEHGIHSEILAYGNMVDVFSTYESRRKLDDPAPFARGINSIQLLRDGQRYWIVNIYWDTERPGSPIPGRYLSPPVAVH